jgi:predicted heme/steroid binding protein/uncharacterized membrane protein
LHLFLLLSYIGARSEEIYMGNCNRIILTIPFLLALLFPAAGFCTVEYAQQTGRNCSDCHVDPAGGGELTKTGEAFKKELLAKGNYKPLTKAQHIVRFITGYLHMITAIMWFGTILYVHLILKPAYAARGLPRSELLVGWICITIMALTGTLLTIARIPTWWTLFHTRFGILLSIKIGLFLVMVLSAAFVTFVIGPRLKKKTTRTVDRNKKDLTENELLQFDGKEGHSTYIAYNGHIYDVSNSKLWKGGSHMKRHAAGFNLTNVLTAAPHGEDRVLGMPVVGKLIGNEPQAIKKPKLFYFMAYMNLTFVFLIVFIICLWRWW